MRRGTTAGHRPTLNDGLGGPQPHRRLAQGVAGTSHNAHRESEIHSFLEHPQMTITELDQRTLQSGFSLQVESVINDLSYKTTEGIELTKKEKMHLKNLAKLLATAL